MFILVFFTSLVVGAVIHSSLMSSVRGYDGYGSHEQDSSPSAEHLYYSLSR